jgi:putative ABC transport system permease protein
MRLGRIIVHRCRSLFRRSRAEVDLQREIDLHIEQLAKEQMAAGMTESEAFAAARREFGSIVVTEESCRDMRGINFIDELARDLSFAFRTLRKSPAFTLTEFHGRDHDACAADSRSAKSGGSELAR